MDLPWDKLDVTTFSWQKVLGGEAAHGMLILSPRAVERLESYTPPWPLPKIFRLTKGGKLIEGIFEGETINTPSMLAVEDYLVALDWAKSIGGLKGLIARADANAASSTDFVRARDWIANLAEDPATRSTTSVCLRFTDPAHHRRRGLRQGGRQAAGEGGRGASTSAPTATRLRACGSGAARRSRRRTSRR
jgi:phosphoserine aminotransferase